MPARAAGGDPRSQLHAAELAVLRLRGTGSSLIDVLNWYSGDGLPVRNAPTLRECAAEYLRSKENGGRRPDTLRGYRVALERFCLRFGERQPYTIEPSMIVQFLAQWQDQNTRASWYRRLFTFFGWLVLKRYAFDNPVNRAGEKPLSIPGARHLYTVDEAKAILELTHGTDQIGYWVLSLFAGMRRAEIKRFGSDPDPWRLIRLEDRLIEVPAGYSKNRFRVIPMNATLRLWLGWVRRRGVPFWPPDADEKLRLTRRRVMGTSEGTFVACSNLGRRSFINYSLALPGATYAQVAAMAGNSELVIRKYYRRDVTRQDAMVFFRLTPRRLGLKAS